MPSARAWAGPWSVTGSPSSRIVAGVRLVDAGQDLDERALAGAVLADQRVDLTGPELERDVVERLGRAEPLRDAAQSTAARAGDGDGASAIGHRSTRDAVVGGRVLRRRAPDEVDVDPARAERGHRGVPAQRRRR